MSDDIFTDDHDPGGEGFVRARDDAFTLHFDNGPWRLILGESDISGATASAAEAQNVADVVLMVDVETDEENFGVVLEYLDAAAARALAAQLLTAADAADAGDHWSPETDTAEYEFGGTDGD